ncbi:MAG: 2-oxo acid dehydrogenase subunit E2 [Deltaproteobacteria bacterium]|nr:2-oxo acid dehydrogenase subunit E2 [Deltaproteobacteria bacterium]
MPTKIILTMPQPGETITEGNIVKWIVKPGDFVKEKQPIVELETEKALFEYESPYEGKLSEIVAPDGSTVAVGNPIAVFEVEDARAATYFMLGIGKKVDGGAGKVERAEKIKKESAPAKAQKGEAGAQKLSPLVRHLLQEYNIDLAELDRIKGTGPGGRITKENILQYLESQKKPAAAKEAEEEIIPFSPVRLRIAENMMRSKANIPHAHTTSSIDMTPVVEYRNRVKADFEKKNGIPLGLLPLLFPALKKAIREYPVVNAGVREEGGKKLLAVHKKINLGVAVDTERGLYIPVIPNAQDKGYLDLARELEALIKKARENKLMPADLTGMTFTFNNYGYYGTTHGVQIILPPQSTTLGMGVIEKRAWVVGDQIQIRHVAEFTVAFDHRVIDGRDAGLFLSSLKKSLENFSEKDLH